MKLQTLSVEDYIEKINRVESMLEEIKQGLFYFDKGFQESISAGEQDIKKGRIIICKTKEDLDRFFAL